MSAREEILGRLRAQQVESQPLPELVGDWVRYADRDEQFRLAVTQAAGRVVFAGHENVSAAIRELDVVRGAAVCCSLLPDVPGNTELPKEPSGFANVDVLIARAEFGVAENGAVWIDGGRAPARAGLFLAQHLVIWLPRAQILDNMHQAYERLGPQLGGFGYGCFMAGPSKTADIEQALVVGAHGPRSLTIVCH